MRLLLILTSIFIHSLVFLAPAQADEAQRRPDIERLMRELQARHWYVYGEYFEWPANSKGETAPHYPRDCFYGEKLSAEESRSLVTLLYDVFYIKSSAVPLPDNIVTDTYFWWVNSTSLWQYFVRPDFAARVNNNQFPTYFDGSGTDSQLLPALSVNIENMIGTGFEEAEALNLSLANLQHVDSIRVTYTTLATASWGTAGISRPARPYPSWGLVAEQRQGYASTNTCAGTLAEIETEYLLQNGSWTEEPYSYIDWYTGYAGGYYALGWVIATKAGYYIDAGDIPHEFYMYVACQKDSTNVDEDYTVVVSPGFPFGNTSYINEIGVEAAYPLTAEQNWSGTGVVESETKWGPGEDDFAELVSDVPCPVNSEYHARWSASFRSVASPDFDFIQNAEDECVACADKKTAGTSSTSDSQVAVRISLGQDELGVASGAVSISASAVSWEASDIDALSVQASEAWESWAEPDTEETTGTRRQVTLPPGRGLLDVQYDTPSSGRAYTARFYSESQFNRASTSGFPFNATGTPIRTVQVAYDEQLVADPLHENATTPVRRLRVTEQTGSADPKLEEYLRFPDRLEHATGINSSGIAQRRLWSTTTYNSSNTERTTTECVSGNVRTSLISKTIKIEELGPKGWRQKTEHVLADVTADPSNSADKQRVLTTSWTYYNTPSDPNSHGKLKQVTNPDGSWERTEYGTYGRVVKSVHNFKNGVYDETNSTTRAASEAANVTTTHEWLNLATSPVSFTPAKTWWGTPIATGGSTMVADEISCSVVSYPYDSSSVPMERTYDIRWKSDGSDREVRWVIRCAEASAPGTLSTFIANIVNGLVAGTPTKLPYATDNLVEISERAKGENDVWQDTRSLSSDGKLRISTDAIVSGDRVETELSGYPDENPSGTDFLNVLVGGTRTVTVTNTFGMKSVETYDIQATSTTSDDLLLSYTEEQYPDSLGRPTKTMYLDNSVEQVEYGCCGVTKRIGRDGSETRYTLDPGSGRTLSETRDLPQGGSVTLAYEYDSEGRVTKVTREPYPAGDNAIVEKTTYDAAGRVIESVANGITTTNDYHREFYSSGSSRVMWSSVTSTQAGTGTSSLTPTQTQAVYPDGRKLRATGNTGLRTECDYAVELVASGSPNIYRLVTTETVLDASGTATSQWTKTDQDYLGRTDRIRYPGSGTVASKSFYGPKGLLVKQEDPDGVRTLYRSGWDTSTHSEFEISAIDMDSDLTNRTDDRNGLIDLNGVDRVTRIDRKAVADLDVTQDFPYGTRATTRQLDTASSDSSWTTIATADTFAGDARSVSYLGSSSSLLKSVTTTALNTTNHTRTVTTTSPDGISRETVYKFGMLVSDRSLSGSTEITKRVTAYDVHGRVASVTDNDPQSGTNNLTTTYTYLTIPSSPATVRDLVATVTTPLAAGTGTSQTTTYEYDPFGRVSVATLPDSVSGSHTVATTYDEAGRVKTVRGARTYPVDYSYDYRGNLEALSTYRTEGNSSTKATTKWIYDGARGWLTEKRYPASDTGIPPTSTTNGPTYTYTKAGRTATRTWARPVSTTYSYNEAGDLTSIEYDDATPGVYFGFDRRGRKTYVTDGAAERELTYDALDRVTKEEITDGTLQNLWQEQAFDDYGRRQSMAFHHATTPLATYNFAYNTNSQLDRVWRGQFMGVYDYEPHGTRVQSHTLRNLGSAPSSTPATNAGSEIAHAARTYDGLGRLTALDWQSASGISTTTLPETYAYTLNKANQRTAMTMTAGGSGDRPSYRWDFSYDTYGQLTGASKVWVSVPEQATGQQFGYTFDAIGNRTSAGKSEPSAGSPYASWAYTTDFTNKYTERSVPRKVDLMGYSSASSVHIAYANSPGSPGYENASSRQPSTSSVGPYFRHVLDYTGNSGAIDDAATVNTSTSVPVFAPATPEEYTYDEDGNLTGDGRCLYTWDAENRLIQVDLQPALAGFASVGFQGSWVYDYDYLGRRVRKYRITIDENSFSGGEEMRAGTPANTKPRPRRAAARSGDEMGIISDVSLFMYDGWLLTEELTSSKAVDRSYVWGLDISGSLQGAGGIGGLLFQINGSTPTTTNTRWASHDPQGNVTALRSVTNNSRWAWTEYGPFGETLMSAGTTEEFKLQYSSKYFDSESGLSYFGYRYYNAGTGKWMSRDPLEERSCANLFAFTGNHPQNSFDALGLEEDPALVQVMTQDELKAATAGTGVGSIQFINGKTGVMIAGENMVITGTPQKGMWKPKTGSTSVLFIYKTDNPKKLYRLDYDKIKMGPNAGQLGWEHNQEGVAKILKLTVQNHQPAGRWASNAGRAIKLVKYGGRALFVLGAAQSAVEIYYSENRTRTIIIEAAGWAGAAAGAWGGAKIGAVGGTFFSPGAGTAIGAVSGAIGGGIAGFWLGQTATQKVVDYYFFKTEQEEWKIAEICGGEEGMK